MSEHMLDIYVEFDLFDSRNDHFMKWFIGWLYLWRMQPRCTEYECGGCKWYRCSEDVGLGLVKVSVESSVDMFDFALLLGIDLVRFMKSCPMRVKVAVCRGSECIDMNIRDLEKWYKEFVWGGVEVRV